MGAGGYGNVSEFGFLDKFKRKLAGVDVTPDFDVKVKADGEDVVKHIDGLNVIEDSSADIIIQRNNIMSYFLQNEIIEIEKLIYDPTLEPCFDLMRSCLVWDDERPNDYTTNRYDNLRDLWIARFFIYHSNLPEEEWWISNNAVEYYKSCWKSAWISGVRWPGFRKNRLFLSKKDRDYLEKELETLEELDNSL